MRASSAAAVMIAALAIGCGGPPCRDVESALRLVRARRGAPPGTTARPHAELVIPHHAINALLPEVIATIEPVRLPLPPALRLVGVPEVELASRRVTIEPAPAGKVAAAIDVEARIAGVPIPLGVVTIEAIPELRRDGERRVLAIRFAGDALRDLAPTSAHRALWAASYNKLPAAIRDKLGRLQFIAGVELLARHLGRPGFALLRRHLLSRIDKVTEIAIGLPALPIARAAINRGGQSSAVVVELWTSLPVARGVDAEPVAARGSAHLRMSAEAAMAIANWSIASGTMPRRYERNLAPSPTGAYFPIYGWRRGDRRPLEIHLFRVRSPCSVIVLAAKPEVDSDGDRLRVAVSDGAIERVEGSAVVKVGVWASRLFAGAIEKSRSYAATSTTRIGALSFRSTVTRASLRGDTVTVDLLISPGPRGPRRAAAFAPSRRRAARAAPRPPRSALARRTSGCRAFWSGT